MVTLSAVQASNSLIASSLPPHLVAVFVGATSGIGEAFLKAFAKHARQPKVYFVGRNQDAGNRINAECKALNPEGEYVFIKADVSLIRVVDDVCSEVKSKEKAINVLFLSQGSLVARTETSEKLHFASALGYYSRIRFIVNLLPLLEQAKDLRRVVSVLAAGHEGPIDATDFQAMRISLLSFRGHGASMMSLGLEAVARNAPTVSFIHDFPGSVKTGMGRDITGVMGIVLRNLFKIVALFMTHTPIEECGDRHLFYATSAKYPPANPKGDGSGIALTDGVTIAKGTNGEVGSGVYSLTGDGESSGPTVEKVLSDHRDSGMVDQLWKHTKTEFKRITDPNTTL